MHSIRNFVPILHLLEFKQDLSEKTLDRNASEVIQDGLGLMLAMDPEAPKPKLGTNPLFPQTSENRHLGDRDVWKIFKLDYRGHGSLKITDEAPYPMDMEKLTSKLDKLDGNGKTQPAIIFKRIETILCLCADAVAGKKIIFNRLLFCNIQKSPFQLKLHRVFWKGQVVQYEGETRLLMAYSRYAFSCNAPKKIIRDYVAIYVADIGQVTERSVDVLAYMGVIHRNRKDREEKNSVVYGICTGTYSFIFLKIDNDSRVYHKWISGDPCGENHLDVVTGNIQNILKDAYEDCVAQ